MDRWSRSKTNCGSSPRTRSFISTHPPDRSNWLEAGVVERAQAELDLPVTHVIVDLTRAQAVA
jgi:hypothetical protein